ncbi:FtsW/RodA/SpoVE family cell cycle protein [Paenibacillus sp.]|jgi:rod shape determining protein RodA|uniref:FtsW/RodA/SpoVE family cell cycle protein n=1 Tax=Paenibacillus sp. TaxID=58172 RepID=UPI002818AFF7|nr:FtsW/RodA/SpoVE family cell cycle protein [Paenibacillus sp.]MDR0266692.1 FtsW/RodA/SpoVE family cell cycle protein [Paenibacillus sp.]
MPQNFKRMDMSIILILLALMAFSLFSIYSVTAGRPKVGHYAERMAVYYAVGFVAFLIFSLVSYKLLIKYALYIYLFGLALLVMVLFIGNEYYGARGWMTLPGGLSLQPAELFKLFLIIFISYLLQRKRKHKLSLWRDVVPLGLVTFVPWLLVMAQNDLGNALSYMVILAGLLWVGNMKYAHSLITLVVIFVAVFSGIQAYIHYHDKAVKLISEDLGKKHWIARFDPWLVPELASRDVSWQTYNANLAIGSGGIEGKGYMKGTSIQSERVPLAYADSIFVQIAEEYGFIGSSVLLLLYFILIHRMILIAADCKGRAGPYLITGIIAMFVYQIFVNVGAFIGLMPLTGITLPFISFGGTSLLINMISVGIAMSIRIHGQEEEEPFTLSEKPVEVSWVGKALQRIRNGFIRN